MLHAVACVTFFDLQRFYMWPAGLWREELQEEEQHWVKLASLGDGEAVAQLYQRYAPAIFRYVYYRLGDREAAEDMTSDVFCRALESLPRYQQRGLPFSAWLYRIAGARVIDHYRRVRRRPIADLHPGIPARTGDPVLAAELQLTDEELRWAVTQLTAAQQQVIVLRFVEGLSHEEVAGIVGRSEGAVRVLQYRALETLRKILQERPEGGL